MHYFQSLYHLNLKIQITQDRLNDLKQRYGDKGRRVRAHKKKLEYLKNELQRRLACEARKAYNAEAKEVD